MATQGVQMKLQVVQNVTFDENPHENERIVVILGCANSMIACAKHRCTGGWLKWWYLLSKCRNTSGTSIWIYNLEIFDEYEIIVEIVINKFEFLDKAFPTWSVSPNEFGLNAVPTEHQQTLAVG